MAADRKKKRPRTRVSEEITVDLSRNPDRFCGIAIQKGLITDYQARECLNTQMEDLLDGTEKLIGRYLVEAGYMTEDGVQQVRAIQLADDNALGQTQSKSLDRLGQLAVEEKVISEDTLEDVLVEQKKDSKKGKPKPIGHYIKKRGKVSEGQLDRLRTVQKKRRKRRVIARRKKSHAPTIVMIVVAIAIGMIALALLSK